MPRSPITAAAATSVAWRRLVARRPWIHWLLVGVLSAATASQVSARLGEVAAARESWGTMREVLVADTAAAPGEPLVVSRADVPAAVAPPGAADPDAGGVLVARQHVGAGEIVTALDIAAGGELALVPAGWLAVAITESPPSGAAPGERVRLVSDGVVIAADGVVAAHRDEVTLVAVPADIAPLVPVAAADGRLAVLRVP